MSRKDGAERKRGNRIGFWFFRTAVRTFGLRGAYGLLYFVGLHYLLFDRSAVAASTAYLRKRFPDHGALRRTFDVYRLFMSQGKNLIDRYAVAAGFGSIDIEVKGTDKIRKFLDDPQKGFILLTAHVGNWQVAMTALKNWGRTVSLMMRPEDNIAVKESLQIDQEGEKVKIIYTDDSLGGVIEAMRAINGGGLVSIMGDRTYGYSSTQALFLGGDVHFPYGAFGIAAAVQCPVVVLLSAKIGLKKYVVDVSHVIDAPARDRERKDDAMKS